MFRNDVILTLIGWILPRHAVMLLYNMLSRVLDVILSIDCHS